MSGQPDGTYAPVDDDRPDPGEVVWAWVPYEDDPSQGKDRPVLVIGTATGNDGREVVHALAMTSKDHDRDEAQEAAAGRYWMDIGTGAWDPRGATERGAAQPAAGPGRHGRTSRGGRAGPGSLRPGDRGTAAVHALSPRSSASVARWCSKSASGSPNPPGPY
ncbi:hypothetical protein GCM10023066_55470 [Nocardioides kongjuensis]